MSAQASVLDNVNFCARLHCGGEADIYLLQDKENEFVLKWYRGSTSFDVSTIEKLEHLRVPGIYRIRESGLRDGIPYLVYDFIKGVSSQDVGVIPVPVALGILRQVGKSLLALDAEGIHHGDLNPANILLGNAAETSKFPLQVTLVDFGIVGPGMPAYAAPERFQGKGACTSSDLFSLGMLLFRWTTGEDLLQASGYEDFMDKVLKIDTLEVDERLYGSGKFSAGEIAALAPLWKALLRAKPEDRCEDFDELDELLEIALDSLGMGDIRVASEVKKFAGTLEDKFSGRKVPVGDAEGSKTPFPYQKQGISSPKKKRKYAVLALFGLILVLIALFVAIGTKSPDIDETGDLLLERSRNMESATMESDSDHKSQDTVPSTILTDLPTPVSE